ncbi:hypothetical protein MUU72_27770 [Streptomyces sp. RS10V-4]|uniref:hypothetical protein n=1 Tax=Streptomyces rhizoryzae TaxID=2932493 RepID=UPI002004F8F5|nr:hypothetical protein [Streptomyces rhizoryzae]MCK7626853.1 hypothetical protein [Streptomyces rhizoryzae]
MASSPFREDGFLTDEAIRFSEVIQTVDKMGNPILVGEGGVGGLFRENGGNVADWGKYASERYASPQEPFEVHFYRNKVTGEILLFDYKIKFGG